MYISNRQEFYNSYDNNNVIITILQDMRTQAQSEEFIQAFSGIFSDIQQYSAMFRHIEVH